MISSIPDSRKERNTDTYYLTMACGLGKKTYQLIYFEVARIGKSETLPKVVIVIENHLVKLSYFDKCK